MRKLTATLAAVLAIGCLLAPALAPAKKGKGTLPKIEPLPTALYDKADDGVWFTVNAFHADSVSIKYGSNRRTAQQIKVDGGTQNVIHFTWQALFKGGTRKSCYDIVVTAQNKHGSLTRKRQACRLGQKP